MTRYFFETLVAEPSTKKHTGHYRMYVTIENQYYWSMEWTGDKRSKAFRICNISAGFMLSEITEKCKSLQELDNSELKERFNTFANYIERAVSGFKSYIAWINPDPHASEISWEFSLK